MVKFTLYQFLGFFLFVSHSSFGVVERSLVQTECAKILQSLISQAEPEYLKYSEGTDLAGYCGPACIINGEAGVESVLHSRSPSREHLANNIDLFMEGAPTPTSDFWIPRGTTQKQRRQLTETYFGKKGYEYEIDDISGFLSMGDLSKLADPQKPGSYSLLGVYRQPPSERQGLRALLAAPGHMVLVTGHNPKEQELHYVDPVYPSNERVLKYSVVMDEEKPILFADAPDLRWMNRDRKTGETPEKSTLYLGGATVFNIDLESSRKAKPVSGSKLNIPSEELGRKALAYFDKDAAFTALDPKDGREVLQILENAVFSDEFKKDPLDLTVRLRALLSIPKYKPREKVIEPVVRFLEKMVQEGVIGPNL